MRYTNATGRSLLALVFGVLLLSAPVASAGNLVINNATGGKLWVATFNYFDTCVAADANGTGCARWQSQWFNEGWWELGPNQMHNMTFAKAGCVALQDPAGDDFIAKHVDAGTTFDQSVGTMWVHPTMRFSMRIAQESSDKISITSLQIGDENKTPPSGVITWTDADTSLTGFGMKAVDCLGFDHDGFVRIAAIPPR